MTDEKKYCLIFDHGTGGPKTAIVSMTGEVLDWAFQEVPLLATKGGGVEQDPSDWWSAMMKTAKKVIDNGKVPVEDIVAVCNTSQWSGTVAVDEDGNHLMNSIIWMDTRGSKYIAEVYKSIFQVSGYPLFKILKLLKITGGAPGFSGKDPTAHILLIKNEFPEIYGKTYMFLEPQDFINLKLTGKFATTPGTVHLHWLTDIRDINNVHYSKKLFKMFKLDPEKFPKELNCDQTESYNCGSCEKK